MTAITELVEAADPVRDDEGHDGTTRLAKFARGGEGWAVFLDRRFEAAPARWQGLARGVPSRRRSCAMREWTSSSPSAPLDCSGQADRAHIVPISGPLLHILGHARRAGLKSSKRPG